MKTIKVISLDGKFKKICTNSGANNVEPTVTAYNLVVAAAKAALKADNINKASMQAVETVPRQLTPGRVHLRGIVVCLASLTLYCCK